MNKKYLISYKRRSFIKEVIIESNDNEIHKIRKKFKKYKKKLFNKKNPTYKFIKLVPDNELYAQYEFDTKGLKIEPCILDYPMFISVNAELTIFGSIIKNTDYKILDKEIIMNKEEFDKKIKYANKEVIDYLKRNNVESKSIFNINNIMNNFTSNQTVTFNFDGIEIKSNDDPFYIVVSYKMMDKKEFMEVSL